MSANKLIMACAAWCMVTAAAPVAAFVTFGNGFGSKWGADPNAGTGAIVTWGYMLDGTNIDPDFRIDPVGFPDIIGTVGSSNITQLRTLIDTNHGAGSFDAAIESAFDTWSAVANITFVGPIADSGLDVASIGATSPDIRIGAFAPEPTHSFANFGAVGFGPPGPPNPFDDFPLAGDILFNLNGIGMTTSFQIAPGEEDVTPVDTYQFGDDLEGLFLHELGHAAMGLGHPSWDGEDPDERVMYVGDFQTPGAPFCCQSLNRELHPDDIAGARFVYGIRGDFDSDSDVDGDDLAQWEGDFGVNGDSDADVDEDSDGADFVRWQQNFGIGTAPPTASATVPEPATGLLFVLSVGLILGGWPRSHCDRYPFDSNPTNQEELVSQEKKEHHERKISLPDATACTHQSIPPCIGDLEVRGNREAILCICHEQSDRNVLGAGCLANMSCKESRDGRGANGGACRSPRG